MIRAGLYFWLRNETKKKPDLWGRALKVAQPEEVQLRGI
jgi:hypothetical protein